jgi:peptidyl-prolyl cis-trans isomerase C
VAAEVNNEKIMMVDLERMVSSYRERVPALSTDNAEAKAALQQIREQILDGLITQSLLHQEAKRRKLTPKREDVDKAVLQFKSSFQKDADFEQMLTSAGKTTQDVRQRIEEELAIRELTRVLTADVTVPEAEIQKFYDANVAEFTVPDRIAAHHILISFPQKKAADGTVQFTPPSASEKAKLLARARNVLKMTQAKGADFEKLAVQHSEDPTAKGNAQMEGNKGNLGDFSRDRVLKSFGDAAFAAPVGKIIGPVETEYGFHIIRVNAKTPGHKLPLSRVREDIQMVLLQDKVRTRLDESIKGLQQKAVIKKNI